LNDSGVESVDIFEHSR